jgi:hypothetical protein
LAEVDKQKVDALQETSETVTNLYAEKLEVDIIRDVAESQTDLDKMLSSEVQDTHRKPGGLGDDKPTEDDKVSTLYASYCISRLVLPHLFLIGHICGLTILEIDCR